MNIVDADSSHKSQTLKILDEFIDEMRKVNGTFDGSKTTSAIDHGGKIFDYSLTSEYCMIKLLVDETGEICGLIEVNILPKIRRGSFFAEIETIYVKSKHQGSGYGKKLIDEAVSWVKESYPSVKNLRVSSGLGLIPAHKFYENYGFSHFAKTFKIDI